MKKTFRRAFVEITNACNLACSFCASSARPIREMTPDEFENAARQAGDLAEMISPHLLGEPLKHSRFPEILASCSRLGLKVNLVTNGLLLRTFPHSLYAEKCLSQVSISLHALSSLPPQRREAELQELAAFALAKPQGLTVGFRLRSDGADDFYRLAVKTLLTAFKTSAGPGADHIKLASGTFLNFGGVFNWPGAAGGRPRRGCLGLRHHFGILSDGRVVPCCADFDGALALGRLNDAPLADILSSPAALSLRSSLTGNTSMPPFCASCGFSPPGS